VVGLASFLASQTLKGMWERMNVKHNDKSLSHIEDKSFISARGIKNPTGDMIIELHKQNRKSDDAKVKYYFDDALLRFVEWLEQKSNLSYNSAITLISPLRGFFSYFREP